MEVKWVVEDGTKYVDLPNLAYITEVNLYNLESEDLDVYEVYTYFWRFDEDIKDSSIPCEEKKTALKVLWENLKEIKAKDESWIDAFPKDENAPLSRWWWHPKLWNNNIDIYEVLKNVCPEDK